MTQMKSRTSLNKSSRRLRKNSTRWQRRRRNVILLQILKISMPESHHGGRKKKTKIIGDEIHQIDEEEILLETRDVVAMTEEDENHQSDVRLPIGANEIYQIVDGRNPLIVDGRIHLIGSVASHRLGGTMTTEDVKIQEKDRERQKSEETSAIDREVRRKDEIHRREDKVGRLEEIDVTHQLAIQIKKTTQNTEILPRQRCAVQCESHQRVTADHQVHHLKIASMIPTMNDEQPNRETTASLQHLVIKSLSNARKKFADIRRKS